MEDQPGNIRAYSNLMCAMPVTRCRNHVRDSLQSPAALPQVLKIIAAGAVEKQDVRQRALRRVIEHAVVCGDAQLKKCFVQPDLIFERNKAAALIGSGGGGLWIERVQAEVDVV